LESRVGELTDDEAALALSNAKQNEDFYKKQVDGIRKEYKEREDFKSAQEQAELEEEQQQAYNQYQQNIVNAISQFNSVGNLDLNMEDADRDELADFMLAQDETGHNYLYRALQDPETLVKAAWFILNGDEAFDSISDYFTN
jgi:23S rRNA pseudoU1915 N3-methylase RlmH